MIKLHVLFWVSVSVSAFDKKTTDFFRTANLRVKKTYL